MRIPVTRITCETRDWRATSLYICHLLRICIIFIASIKRACHEMHYNLVESHRRAIVLLVIMHRNLQVAISAMRPVQCTFPHSLSHSLSLSLSLSLSFSLSLLLLSSSRSREPEWYNAPAHYNNDSRNDRFTSRHVLYAHARPKNDTLHRSGRHLVDIIILSRLVIPSIAVPRKL